MSHILWIKNGRVIDPANQRDANGDIFAIDGKIVDSISDAQKTANHKRRILPSFSRHFPGFQSK